MERIEFERLVRDALNNLYDLAALQTHPLAGHFTPDAKSRAQQLRDVLIAAIERLRPAERGPTTGSPEWRPYLLLYGRYVEGESLTTLQARLALSERQLRREHGRAVEAVAALLWDRFFPNQRIEDATHTQLLTEPEEFSPTSCPLDVIELINGLLATMQGRAANEGVKLEAQMPACLPRVLADRVILRQILLSLLSYACEATQDGRIIVGAEANGTRVVIWIQVAVGNATDGPSPAEQRTLKNVLPWAQRLQVGVSSQSVTDQPSVRQLMVNLPRADRPVVLIVDDQDVALRLYQRYLSQTDVHLVGLRDGSRTVEEARRLQPQAIILDVMMPQMDGWEVLQSLQADPFTRHIPVVVCSVWEEPELALSLGATDFLSKPITRRDFLAALTRLGLLETSPESPSTTQ